MLCGVLCGVLCCMLKRGALACGALLRCGQGCGLIDLVAFRGSRGHGAPQHVQLPHKRIGVGLGTCKGSLQLRAALVDDAQLAPRQPPEQVFAQEQQRVCVDSRARLGLLQPIAPLVAVHGALLRVHECGPARRSGAKIVAVVDAQVFSRGRLWSGRRVRARCWKLHIKWRRERWKTGGDVEVAHRHLLFAIERYSNSADYL
jgi:hypothetical protein